MHLKMGWVRKNWAETSGLSDLSCAYEINCRKINLDLG